MSSSSSPESVSSPEVASESRGSSVTTGLREEYEDLLRYAVVTPVLNKSLGGLPATPQTYKNKSSGGPPPRPSPPRPHTPPRHASRNEIKVKVSKMESEDTHSEFSDVAPQVSVAPRVASVTVPPPKPSSPLQLSEVEETSFPGTPSNDSGEDSIHPPATTPEVARLVTQLDGWCLDLKRNVLVEFDQAKILMMERHQAELIKERQRHAHEIEQLREELEHYKELLVTYEQSIARKDHIIANLTRALHKQKDHIDLQRTFSSWKLRHVNDKRESFTYTLAKRHHQRKIMSRVWAAWFGVMQGRWKHKVEKACQNKAEEVCVQLTSQYEEQVANIQQSLESCQQEVARLKEERNLYEENMKKAFMRGVCALNLEAMTMFQHNENESVDQQHNYTSAGDCQPLFTSLPMHDTSEPSNQQEFHPEVPITRPACPQSQVKPGSKSVHVTTSTAACLRGGRTSKSKQVQAGSSKNYVQRTSQPVPLIVVEKH